MCLIGIFGHCCSWILSLVYLYHRYDVNKGTWVLNKEFLNVHVDKLTVCITFYFTILYTIINSRFFLLFYLFNISENKFVGRI